MKMCERILQGKMRGKKIKVPFFIFIDFGIFISIWIIDKVMFIPCKVGIKIFVKMLSIFKAQCQ